MLYDPMNLPREEVNAKPVYFNRYEDFCYCINGHLYVYVQEIGERETAILISNSTKPQISALVKQSSLKMFENIEPEELMKAGFYVWLRQLQTHEVYRCNCIEQLFDYLSE